MSFETLPPELYDAIFYQVPTAELQETVLATTRAIPFACVPVHHLFRCIHLRAPEQAILLYRRLRNGRNLKHAGSPDVDASSLTEREQAAGWVKEFLLETWSVDAEIVINLIRLLPNLQALTIWVGPNSFAPEHLEELFLKPLLGLRYLALRFRPYVQKATYYQFLKGAYFDSTLVALSRWPSGFIPTLSIVQDPLDQQEQKQTFAQPIVFFRFDLSVFLRSPALSPALTSLRLRVPCRPVARSLCSAAAANDSSNSSSNLPLVGLKFLDLSTCGVLENEVDTIMVRFPSLQHLILDGCQIMRGDLRDGEWNALGRRCALVGVRRAKDREKVLKAWLESSTVVETIGSDAAPAMGQDPNRGRKVKGGRKGLATATISFRKPDPVVPSSLSRPPVPQTRVGQAKKKIRILPPISRLVSLSIALSSMHTPDKYPTLRAEFEEGWAEGVAVLAITRSRLRRSAGNGVRIMKFTKSVNADDEEPEHEEGLDGLEDVDPFDPEAIELSREDGLSSHDPPILCFAGPARAGLHEDNCGHSVGWMVMGDEL